MKYAGVLASASPWRPRIGLKHTRNRDLDLQSDSIGTKRARTYTPWAELLKRTFAIDVLGCPRCQGRMQLLAMVTERASVRRFLAKLGELVEVPERSPSRGPACWKSVAMRRKGMGVGE